MAGDIDEAVQYYQRAIELDPFYEIPYNNLGVIYLDHVGKTHDAIQYLKKAVGLNENYALAYYNLGRAFSFINNRTEAAEYYRLAQELNEFTHELDDEELEARIYHLFTSGE